MSDRETADADDRGSSGSQRTTRPSAIEPLFGHWLLEPVARKIEQALPWLVEVQGPHEDAPHDA